MKSVTRTAPAKINLGLDVVGTRADGYHLLETVFQAVSIADTVTVSLVEQPGIALTCDHNAVPCNPKNIAWKAAQRFWKLPKSLPVCRFTLQSEFPWRPVWAAAVQTARQSSWHCRN